MWGVVFTACVVFSFAMRSLLPQFQSWSTEILRPAVQVPGVYEPAQQFA